MWDLIFGVIVTAVVVTLLWRMHAQQVLIKWYEWFMGAIGLLLLGAGFQHTLGELYEGLPKAAMLGLVILGGLAILLLLATGLSIWRHNHVKSTVN